jgi:hypothetical protein
MKSGRSNRMIVSWQSAKKGQATSQTIPHEQDEINHPMHAYGRNQIEIPKL